MANPRTLQQRKKVGVGPDDHWIKNNAYPTVPTWYMLVRGSLN